ncbi:EAL domain-containing protein [Hansschlegelia zhihuaiae]|uniref:EAL domain-containing protein n=1 Tax=Hansschlegelia zhihuaiae TaxID=405005 RepID=A0A4V1KJB2_9HYPH|nr:EAL domain-containing protein [Hansschlegelia zhihuaiae]RXF73582.1 EAL domain-containing protein [Hansschlegelia zhihuaiae]
MRRRAGEARRLVALRDLRILDTGPEPHLDAVCRTAAALFDAPIALIPLIDETRLWFKARVGVEDAEIARFGSFCDAVMGGGDATVVRDLADDPRFAKSPLVVGPPYARFYAGAPISCGSGHRIGTVCVIDVKPRPDFSERQAAQLTDLVRIVESHLRLHEAELARAAAAEEGRRVADLLEERESRLLAAHESQAIAEKAAGIGHWRIDVAAREILWSDGVSRIFGRNAELKALTLDEHLSFYHPADGERVRGLVEVAAMGQSRADDGGYKHHSRVIRPDGEVRTICVHGVASYATSGKVEALHGVCIDVTDRARSEAKFRDASALLRLTLESMDQGLLMIGPDDRIRICNRRASELLGLSDEVVHEGARLEDIKRHQFERGEFRLETPEMVRRIMEGGVERAPDCYERRRPDGTTLEVRTTALADGGVVRTLTDITARVESARAMEESELRYRLLAENTTDLIIWCELDTTRRYVSPAAKAVLGYDAEELVGTKPLGFVHPDDVEAYRRLLDDLTSARIEHAVTCLRYLRKDDALVWVEVSFSLTRDAATGRPTGYVASLRDVTDRKTAEEELKVSEQRLALALDSGSDGLWDWNLQTGIVRLSDQWFVMLGYDRGDVDDDVNAWATLIHPDDVEATRRLLVDHLKGLTPTFECEYRMRRKDGSYAWTLARGKVVTRSADGRAVRIIGTHIDVTKRKETERQVAHMAVHDALTGLPNRTLFRQRLNEAVAVAERSKRAFALLACDLDRFKSVNDTRGHVAGDALLRTIAERLSSVVREGDTVARLGGDEFAIIVALDSPRAASVAAQRVIDAVGQPIDLDGQAVAVGVSIGVAICPQDAEDADHLFKNADIALYKAKAAGRNTHRFYETGMDAALAERTQLEIDLREAVRAGGLALAFQPIMNAAAGTVSGFEALMRWPHPRRGMVPPSEFIPIAEETGLILPLGDWALREACRAAASWPDEMRVSVNVSGVQFQRPGLEQSVVGALSAAGLPAERLELEITESVLMQDSEAAVSTLLRIRSLGVRIALDDFGTGYSSLSYLRRFPFDKIKIDRSFIVEIDDPETAAIVKAIVGLGERSGAAITAEGVETSAQFEGVRQAGCTEVQGYLFSPPLPAEQAVAFVNRQKRAA